MFWLIFKQEFFHLPFVRWTSSLSVSWSLLSYLLTFPEQRSMVLIRLHNLAFMLLFSSLIMFSKYESRRHLNNMPLPSQGVILIPKPSLVNIIAIRFISIPFGFAIRFISFAIGFVNDCHLIADIIVDACHSCLQGRNPRPALLHTPEKDDWIILSYHYW